MTQYTDQVLGEYLLHEFLGEGRFASVYRATHQETGEEVAIKIMHADLQERDRQRFYEDAERLMSRLQHRHIIQARAIATWNDVPYIVMEYAARGNLQQRHPEGTRLDLLTVAGYVSQIAAALHHAHEQRIVHCDLKPANILLSADESLRLSDFNLSLDLPGGESEFLSTQQVGGTPLYIAPEQIEGHPVLASDQYALGIMIYQWLTGEPPFQGETREMVLAQHMHTVPPSLLTRIPTLPPEIAEIVARTLAKDPRQRYASVDALAGAFLQATLTSQQLPAIPLVVRPAQEVAEGSAGRSSRRVLINRFTREIVVKVVYCGVYGSGKAETLRYLHRSLLPLAAGPLQTIQTAGEPTLFFDWGPPGLPQIQGFRLRFHLSTCPGEYRYQSTQRVLLQDTSVLIFVADTSSGRLAEQIMHVRQIQARLSLQGRPWHDLPVFFQWNTGAGEESLPRAVVERYLNPGQRPAFAADLETGAGVLAGLRGVLLQFLQAGDLTEPIEELRSLLS